MSDIGHQEDIDTPEGQEIMATLEAKSAKSLKGLYRGLKIEEEDLDVARTSLFRNNLDSTKS
ncbi:MAG: hypothetical protein HQL03_00805 [Nitrospirae bacterium]|nr:hypothetical protein [Nitrospirota bacterium]MBF0590525.1 hypothetical protein [Nitrospirota bacterium]